MYIDIAVFGEKGGLKRSISAVPKDPSFSVFRTPKIIILKYEFNCLMTINSLSIDISEMDGP